MPEAKAARKLPPPSPASVLPQETEEELAGHVAGLQAGDRVLVLGGYGVGNCGDEAILAGMMETLPRDIDLVVVSKSPQETNGLHGVKAVSPASALNALRHTDVLIVGGGGIFSGHMGTMGKLIPVFCLMARQMGVRIAFHGLGVYPSTPGWVRKMLCAVSPHLTSFTVRDGISARTLRQWGIACRQIPDLSTFMAPSCSERGLEILRAAGLAPNRPVVGLCLTAVDRKMAAQIVDLLPRVIETVEGVDFLFIPMSHHPTVQHHNDVGLARQLRSRATSMRVLDGWYHPADVLSLFGHLKAAVCMRYHSLLFADRMKTPVIAVAYAEKCQDWLDAAGMQAVPLDGHAPAERICRGIESALDPEKELLAAVR